MGYVFLFHLLRNQFVPDLLIGLPKRIVKPARPRTVCYVSLHHQMPRTLSFHCSTKLRKAKKLLTNASAYRSLSALKTQDRKSMASLIWHAICYTFISVRAKVVKIKAKIGRTGSVNVRVTYRHGVSTNSSKDVVNFLYVLNADSGR